MLLATYGLSGPLLTTRVEKVNRLIKTSPGTEFLYILIICI